MYLNKNDWAGLEYARSICFFSLVCLHGVAWAVSHKAQQEVMVHHPWVGPLFCFLGFFALLTPVTAGATFQISLIRIPREKIFALCIKTGGALFVSGWLMNGLMLGREHLFHWEVLHFLGLSCFCLGGIQWLKFSRAWMLFLIVSLPFGAAGLREISFAKETIFRSILLGDTSHQSYWPLIPWFSLLLLGALLAEEKRRINWIGVLWLGTFLIGGAFYFGEIAEYLSSISVWTGAPFEAPWEVSVALLGAGMVFMSVCTVIQPMIPESFLADESHPVLCFSRGCFWIYLVHMVLGYHLLQGLEEQLDFSVRIVLYPITLVLMSWQIGWLVLWLSRKRFRIRLVKI